MSAGSKRWAGRRLGIQVEGGGGLTAFLPPSPAHPLPQGQAFNLAGSVCAVKAPTRPPIRAGGGGGASDLTCGGGTGGAAPATSAPIQGPAGFSPALTASGSPAGPGRASVPRSFLSSHSPGPPLVATPPRAPQGLRRPRRGEVWADVAPAEGGSPRMRMGEPGELKPELPLSWGLGRSA